MNLFCHVPRENWIVDRMGNEFMQNSTHNVSTSIINADTDLIWLFASWCWNQIPAHVLESKKVICTIHHEVPEKFDVIRKNNFIARDRYVDFYHTYTEETKTLINSLTKKPVDVIPHWVNNNIWIRKNKADAIKKAALPENRFLVGSFQRDTEGFDLKTPKLEKGPDILVEKILDLRKIKPDIHVVLAGWRRQYVIKRLKENNVDFSYFELPDQSMINILYNALDLYVVSSRCEGGPQAIFECSHLETPIISTSAGQSRDILSPLCIYKKDQKIDDKFIEAATGSDAIDFNKSSVEKLVLKSHVKEYDNYFTRILEKK